jgi:hypothetical protein
MSTRAPGVGDDGCSGSCYGFSEKSVKSAAFRRLRPAMQRLSVASSGVPSIAGTAAESSLAPRPLAGAELVQVPEEAKPEPAEVLVTPPC